MRVAAAPGGIDASVSIGDFLSEADEDNPAKEREETKRISIADRPKFKNLFEGEVLHMVFDITSFDCKDAKLAA